MARRRRVPGEPSKEPRPCTRGAHRRGVHRCLLEGLLAIMRTGVLCREMPAAHGFLHTAYNRYQRWREDGLWDRIWAILRPTPSPVNPG